MGFPILSQKVKTERRWVRYREGNWIMGNTIENRTTDKIDMRNDWIVIKHIVPQEIAAFIEDAFFIVEIRRRLGEYKGITFEVHSREQNHSIPHIHASYGEYEISIAIEDGRILSGNLPAKRAKQASEWVRTNREKLLADWKNYALSVTAIMTKSLINTEYDKE